MFLCVDLLAFKEVLYADPAWSAVLYDTTAFLHFMILRDAYSCVAIVLIDLSISYSASVLGKI